jgi:hypothetical protein
MRNDCKILVGEQEGSKTLSRLKITWEV